MPQAREMRGSAACSGRLAAMGHSASIWLYGLHCFAHVRHRGESGSRYREQVNGAARDGIWSRGGVPVEELPDPFASGEPHGSGVDPHLGTVPPEEQEPPKRRRRWPIYLYSISALVFITFIWLVITAPLSRALEPLPNPALLMLSDDGHPIALRGAIKEAPVDVKRLNPLTPAAFVAIEDRRFYSHWGIDPRGIGRAMLANLRGGGVREGGSTITQQLAKTNFLSSNRTFQRKGQEVIIAFWLEGWLTKQEILSRYLSSAYFGDGVYGLRAAAHHYFNRDPERLNLAQSAMLAGMVQAPSRLAPTQHLEAAQARSRLVLQAMAETGVISPARARSTAMARPVFQAARYPTGTYFADWVAPYAQKAFDADFGEVKVPTTLDSNLQRLAVRAVGHAAIGDAQAALVAMRPDGRVVAMVGGKNYGESPFNRVTQARRQPGSAFKLFVYLAAMRAGWTPDSIIEDRPITIDGWTPVNSDGVYRGRITLREAFARSSNAAPVLDLLFAAANNGTGRRAALAVPTFGKTGTTQENRDALFIGFAGDLVVGVWVGRDDNKSLGKISGGTVPAELWRNFMTSALAIDRRRGPDLPPEFRIPQRPEPQQRQLKSPLPPDWSNATKPLREVRDALKQLIG